jgi:phospholipase/lecithinase/hemolysin
VAAEKNFGGKVILIDAFSFIDSGISGFQTYGFRVSNTAIACNLTAQVARAKQLGFPDPSLFGSSLFCSPNTYTTKHADYTFMFADLVHRQDGSVRIREGFVLSDHDGAAKRCMAF